MKIKVEDTDYTYPKMYMKTSVRGNKYSIRFESLNAKGLKYDWEIRPWGHLSKRQAERLINDIKKSLWQLR
jgi:hypothetical protein